MGWERRKRGDQVRGYFYQSVRVPDRPHPIKKYLGRGTAGQEKAAEIERRRQQRELAKFAVQQEHEQHAEVDARTKELKEWIELLATAWLLLAGCHLHHGEWRQRREHEEPRR